MPWILQFHECISLQSNSWELLYVVTCKEAWPYLEALTANAAAPSSINLFRGKAVQSAASSKERRILSLGLGLSMRSKSRWSATTWPTLLCGGRHINMLDPQQSKSRRTESRSLVFISWPTTNSRRCRRKASSRPGGADRRRVLSWWYV